MLPRAIITVFVPFVNHLCLFISFVLLIIRSTVCFSKRSTVKNMQLYFLAVSIAMLLLLSLLMSLL